MPENTCMVHDWVHVEVAINDAQLVTYEYCRDCRTVDIIQQPDDTELQWELEWEPRLEEPHVQHLEPTPQAAPYNPEDHHWLTRKLHALAGRLYPF